MSAETLDDETRPSSTARGGNHIAEATATVIGHIESVFQEADRLPANSRIIDRMQRVLPGLLQSYDGGDFDGAGKKDILNKAVSDLWSLDDMTLATLGDEIEIMQEVMYGEGVLSAKQLTDEMLSILFPEEFGGPTETATGTAPGQPAESGGRALPELLKFLELDFDKPGQVARQVTKEIEKYLYGYFTIDKGIKNLTFEEHSPALSFILIELIDQNKRIGEVADQISAVVVDMVPPEWADVLIAENLPTELGNLTRDLTRYAADSAALIEMQAWVDEFQADLPAVVSTYRSTESKRKRLPEHADVVNNLARRAVQRRMAEKQIKGSRQHEAIAQGANPLARDPNATRSKAPIKKEYKRKTLSRLQVLCIVFLVVVVIAGLAVLIDNQGPAAYEFKPPQGLRSSHPPPGS